MKPIRLHLKNLSVLQIAFILLISGLFFGILFANIFRETYRDSLFQYQNTVFLDVSKENIKYSSLFLYILKNNFKEFAVFWLLSITILGIPYMAYKILAFGFSTGFFISAITLQYGFKGILLILVQIFPHGILYIPVAILCLYKGFYLCRTIYHDKRNHIGSIISQLKSNIPLLIILALLLLMGSFLEAYIGSFLFKKALNLFI